MRGCTVVKKIYGQIGVVRENGLFMPKGADGITKGFAFVEFHNHAEAAAAIEQTNGYKLDKAHVFKVSKFDDFSKYDAVPATYKAPEPKPYVPRENTASYMLDDRGRDQFAIRFGDETEVHWNDAQVKEPVDVYKRSFWTESYVQWSPRGNYLATVHRQGVALWGGPGFARFAKFSHNGVQFIEFSPCERYLASGSTHDPANAREQAQVVVNFFDVRSGGKLRSFQGPISDFVTGAQRGLTWPVFKWAGASDAGAHLDMTDSFAYFPQLLSIGVREKKLIGLEEAVRQITSRPAQLLGLSDRGALKPGYRADLVIFDPDTIGHGPIHTRFDLPAGAGRLFAESVGVSHVFVNGTETFRDGKFQGEYPGRAIRSGRDTMTPPMVEAG